MSQSKAHDPRAVPSCQRVTSIFANNNNHTTFATYCVIVCLRINGTLNICHKRTTFMNCWQSQSSTTFAIETNFGHHSDVGSFKTFLQIFFLSAIFLQTGAHQTAHQENYQTNQSVGKEQQPCSSLIRNRFSIKVL